MQLILSVERSGKKLNAVVVVGMEVGEGTDTQLTVSECIPSKSYSIDTCSCLVHLIQTYIPVSQLGASCIYLTTHGHHTTRKRHESAFCNIAPCPIDVNESIDTPLLPWSARRVVRRSTVKSGVYCETHAFLKPHVTLAPTFLLPGSTPSSSHAVLPTFLYR